MYIFWKKLQLIKLLTEMPLYPTLKIDFTITSDKWNETVYPDVHEDFLRRKRFWELVGNF